MSRLLDRVNSVVQIADGAASLYHRVTDAIKARGRDTVTVPATDAVAKAAMRWFYDRIEPLDRFNRRAEIGDDGQSIVYSVSGDGCVARYHGIPITMSRKERSLGQWVERELEISAPRRYGSAIDQMLIEAVREYDSAREGRVSVEISNGFGFHEIGDRQGRPLTSVVLADGLMEQIASDYDCFARSEAFYRSRSIPYHRGYMFVGPPGTGKSSAIMALCSHFRLPLKFFNISAAENFSFAEVMGGVSPHSCVVVEDLDRSEAGQDGKLSWANILAMMDGSITPDGVLFIITCNSDAEFNDALLRPGRIDRRFEFGLLTEEQANQMHLEMLGCRNDLFAREYIGRAPAEANEALMQMAFNRLFGDGREVQEGTTDAPRGQCDLHRSARQG